MKQAAARKAQVRDWLPAPRRALPVVLVLAASVSYAMLSRLGEAPAAAPKPRPPVIAAAVAAPAAPAAEAPEPYDPFQKRWDAMTAELDGQARRYPGRIAIYVKDLKRGREWSYRADDLFPSASLIKVPVMVGVFDKIHQGDLSLSKQLALRRRLRVGGSGSIKWFRDGTRLSVRQLLDHLIAESDNTAMRILIDETGMGFLQQAFQRMGLVYTEIYPEGLSLSSSRVRYENFTTAREMGMLFEKIYRGEMVDRFSSALMLDILKTKRARTRLAKHLPPGWEIAHKTGLLRRACHDSAIVFSPEGDYAITVLTGQNQSYAYAKDYIAKLGRITYGHYRSGSLYAKRTQP